MMNNTMSYKGYLARIEFDPRDEIFVGRVLGIVDSITFHGTTVTDLANDFHYAIDHYIADCKANGRQAEKPASGKILLRIAPEVHAAVSVAAHASGKSLNQWVAEALARAVQSNN